MLPHLRNVFCVECGRETEKLYDGMCIDCYIKKHNFFSIPVIDIAICKECGAYRIGGKWYRKDIEERLMEYIEGKIEKEIDCDAEINIEKGEIICRGEFGGVEIKRRLPLKMRERHILCDRCSLKKGGYFEAVLQVRKKNLKKEMQEIEGIINRKIDEMNTFISKRENRREGIDYYIGSKKAAAAAAKEIKESFNAEMKKSSSLIGMKDGKELYRDTYMVRLPEYGKESFFKEGERLYRVISVGKKIEMKSLDGVKKSVYREEMEKMKKVEIRTKEADVLHEEKDGLYIMDRENFKTYFVNKPKNWKGNKRIKIVEWNDNIYVIE